MAVTLTELAGALRLGDAVAAPVEPVRGILDRLLGAATALVEATAPDAPTAVRDEAVIRLASYWYDSPPAPHGGGFASAFRNSGAEALVSRFISRRAVGAGDGEGPAGDGGDGVTLAQVREEIRENDEGHLVWR